MILLVSSISVDLLTEAKPDRHAGEMNKTITPSINSIDRQWYLVDAENQTLGRLASEVASVLRGKNKANFTPHLDTGDFVVIVNADKVTTVPTEISGFSVISITS